MLAHHAVDLHGLLDRTGYGAGGDVLAEADEDIARLGDGVLEGLLAGLGAHLELGDALLGVGGDALNALDGLESLGDGLLAVRAHHAVYAHGDVYELLVLGGSLGALLVLARLVLAGVVHLEQVQTQGVGDDAEGAEAHRGGAEHRVERDASPDEAAGGDGDADGVVEEGPEQVLVYVAQRGAGHADGGGDVAQLALHEHDVGRVDGDVGTGSDGDADVGAGQGGGVVDAVADHGDLALLHELADDALLAVGQDAGDDLVHARLGADGLRGALVVAGEHDDADAHVAQLANGARAVLLDDVGHGDDAGELAALGKVQRGLALLGEGFGLLAHVVGDGGLGDDELVVAGGQLFAVHGGDDAVAGQSLKGADLGSLHVQLLAALHDGASQRVLALLFEREGEAHEVFLADALGGEDVGDLGLAGGDGTGLVQGYDVHLAGLLEGSGGLEQDAVLGAHAVADHDGDRGREAERAGAADDQDGDAAREGVAEVIAEEQPHYDGDYGDGDDGGDEDAGDLVGDLGDGRLGRGGVGDHLDDLAEGGVLADAGGLALDKAALVERGGADAVALGLVDRDALAGERALVDGAVAFKHYAVDGDVLARADNEDVALLHFLDAHGDLLAVAEYRGGLGGELHEALERVGGLALAARFEHLADGDEREYHRGGLEVELRVHDVHLIHRSRLGGHLKERVAAPYKRGGGAERDQGVHVGRLVREALEAGDEELLVDYHDDDGQVELDERLSHIVGRQELRQRPAPHHRAHGEIHEHYQEAYGRNQAALEHRSLVILQRGLRLCHGAGGALLAACALLAGAVAGVHDRLDYVGGGSGALDAHGIGQQADRAAGHARYSVHGLLNSGAAGRAAHACDIKLLHTIPFTSLLRYLINFCKVLSSSSMVSSLPSRISSTTQVRMWSLRSSRLKAFIAAVTAADCTRMSGQ